MKVSETDEENMEDLERKLRERALQSMMTKVQEAGLSDDKD